jgi:hypothetical protein
MDDITIAPRAARARPQAVFTWMTRLHRCFLTVAAATAAIAVAGAHGMLF